jgi:hypothetical protein
VRVPLTFEVDSRDGLSNKDSRLTNVLVESDEGTQLATVRPALETVSSNTGNGNGVTSIDGTLISVFGTVLGFGATPSSIGTVTNGTYDFAEGVL